MHLRPGILTLLAAVGLFAPAARADRMAQELRQRAPDIITQLKKKGYKTAGLLRFRVEERPGKPSFTAPMCGRMVDRLEALLVIHAGSDEAKALGVVRDAGLVAGRKGVTTFLRKEDREKFFQLRYPMAWGQALVTPDVFLMGQVSLSADRKRTSVALEAFDAESPAAVKTLTTFAFATDREVLRDLGYGYELTPAARSRLGASRDAFGEDVEIVKEVNKERPPDKAGAPKPKAPPIKQRKGAPAAASPQNVGGVSVQMLVDKKPAPVEPNAADGDGVKLKVMSPKPGQKVLFKLTNTTDQRRGVVVRLNGVNTLFEQTQPPDQCAKYNLPPKAEAVLEGYVQEGAEKVKPFAIVVGPEAAKRAEQFGDKAALIEVDVYEDVGGDSPDKVTYSERGLPPSKDLQSRQSFQGLRNAMLKSTGLKTVVKSETIGGKFTSRELIVPDDKVEKGKKWGRQDLKNPRPIAALTIKVVPNDDYSAP